MISSQYVDSAWMADLVRNQQCHSLHRVVATVNVVPHEQVVIIWDCATNFEKFNQIMELSVNITAHIDWCTHFSHV